MIPAPITNADTRDVAKNFLFMRFWGKIQASFRAQRSEAQKKLTCPEGLH